MCVLSASSSIHTRPIGKGSPLLYVTGKCCRSQSASPKRLAILPCSCTCHSYSLSGIDVLYMLIHEMINTNGCFIYPFSYLRFFVFDFFYVGSLRFERLVGCYNTQTVCCIRALSTAWPSTVEPDPQNVEDKLTLSIKGPDEDVEDDWILNSQ